MHTTLHHAQLTTPQRRVTCSIPPRISRPWVACRVAEISRSETDSHARQDALLALLASHMSFEGEFRPIDEWSRLNMAIQQGNPARPGADATQQKLQAPARPTSHAPAAAPAPNPALIQELQYLEQLLEQLRGAHSLAAKV